MVSRKIKIVGILFVIIIVLFYVTVYPICRRSTFIFSGNVIDISENAVVIEKNSFLPSDQTIFKMTINEKTEIIGQTGKKCLSKDLNIGNKVTVEFDASFLDMKLLKNTFDAEKVIIFNQ